MLRSYGSFCIQICKSWLFFFLMLFPHAKAQGKVPQLETDRKEFFESLHDLKTAIAKLDCVVRKASQGNLL